MANRAQRRAAKKRPGENYMDVLTKRQLIKESIDRQVYSNAVSLEADIKTQRFLWMAVIALNEEFGFGGERAKRFLVTLQEVAEECQKMAQANGGYYARQKLMERASQITGIEITPVHEEAMRQAKEENERNGVHFPEDLDNW